MTTSIQLVLQYFVWTIVLQSCSTNLYFGRVLIWMLFGIQLYLNEVQYILYMIGMILYVIVYETYNR